MKILYGVQGTGNGHISRANAMSEAFNSHPDLQVNWLLSGRDRAQGCGTIATFDWRRGLTFVADGGGVRILETLRRNDIGCFLRDVGALDLTPYDLVVSDYEPVICHAARRRGIPVVGISHLYAFAHPVPLRGANPVSRLVLRKFAPVTVNVGLHWHHFGQPVLPPILDLSVPPVLPPTLREKIVVYLPWEDPVRVLALLAPHQDFEFHIYHPAFTGEDRGNLHLRALSRSGFKQDLLDCHGVVANCGFELISECLQLGKRVLTRPLGGQMEQSSNAAALEQLGYAETMKQLDPLALKRWLHSSAPAVRMHYPDVAHALAAWIADSCRQPVADLAEQLWRATTEDRQSPLQDEVSAGVSASARLN